MRYCNQCRRITLGNPLYCTFCGSSYDVKLCPARHINPTSAMFCSECGSRDLSTPAPPLRFWFRLVLRAVVLLIGSVLLIFSIGFLIAFASGVFTNPDTIFPYLLASVILALIWYGYVEGSSFIFSFLKRTDLLPKRKRGRPPK